MQIVKLYKNNVEASEVLAQGKYDGLYINHPHPETLPAHYVASMALKHPTGVEYRVELTCPEVVRLASAITGSPQGDIFKEAMQKWPTADCVAAVNARRLVKGKASISAETIVAFRHVFLEDMGLV